MARKNRIDHAMRAEWRSASRAVHWHAEKSAQPAI
jgi:hypothetical protein